MCRLNLSLELNFDGLFLTQSRHWLQNRICKIKSISVSGHVIITMHECFCKPSLHAGSPMSLRKGRSRVEVVEAVEDEEGLVRMLRVT